MVENASPTETDRRLMHGLLMIILLVVSSFFSVGRIWPLIWIIPLVAYAGLVATIPPLRRSFVLWPFGCASPFALGATIAIAVISCAALIAFHATMQPNVAFFRNFLPVSALGGLLSAGFLFSTFNALFEEVVFRGILFDAIESLNGKWIAALGSACLFGYGHMHGYPPGPLGAILAGVYGLCLGWLRIFSGGLGLPFIAHIAADATIFVILVQSGVF